MVMSARFQLLAPCNPQTPRFPRLTLHQLTAYIIVFPRMCGEAVAAEKTFGSRWREAGSSVLRVPGHPAGSGAEGLLPE